MSVSDPRPALKSSAARLRSSGDTNAAGPFGFAWIACHAAAALYEIAVALHELARSVDAR